MIIPPIGECGGYRIRFQNKKGVGPVLAVYQHILIL